ncbi:MAG: flippase-like domain-containing protein [Deltaproteobacteria bacterium]|nr:flippase-like domain-containing protein [Deltaproteobacteria bacterium]
MDGPSCGESSAANAGVGRRARLRAARALPWVFTVVIFASIFKRVPFASVWHALEDARLLPYLAIMAPYSVFYLAIDTFCLTRVINWFNCRVAYADVLPIRATTYLLTLVNSNLGQGGIALYLNRRDAVPLLEVASSVLFMMFVELYQLTFFSSLGVLLAPRAIDLPLGAVYAGLYGYLVVHLVLFRVGRDWLALRPAARILRSFRLASPRHYLLLLLYKSPNFLMATVVYYIGLQCFGMRLPYRELLLFLPIIFFSAALPIGAAHLGAPQFLWIYFFARYAPEPSLLAFSLATHFIFMIMNAALGLPFLPRAIHELIRGADAATN